MRQKVLFTTFVLLITASVSNVHAQLFSAVSPSGHTLYYQWNYDDSYYSGGNTQYNSVMVVSSGSAYSIDSFNGSVIIPDSVTYGSRKYAVTRIKSLMAPNITNLTIPNTVRKIDADALDLCGFSTLTIPVGVTSVGSGIAMNCPNLTTVYYNARSATQPTSSCGALFSWTVRNVIIGDSVEHIPSCFCTSRDSLRTVTILGHVKSIGERAFSYCKNLRSIVIPSSVEQIGVDAFVGCKNLDTVYYNAINCTTRYSRYDGAFHTTNISMLFIGDSVQKIHLYTFDTVQTAFSKNTTPPVVDCYARDYSGSNSYSFVTNAKIFTGTGTNVIVPCGSLETYQSQFAWNNNNISDDCVNVVGIANNDSFGIVIGGSTCSPNTPLTMYALPYAGYTFVGWADNNYDNPRNVVSVAGDIVFTAIFSPKDTVILYDTMIVVDTLTQYIDVHDTTYIDVPYAVHDTTTLYDTMILTEYVPVHDTTIQHDTIYFPVFTHDTTYVTVHDTTTLYDTLIVTEYYAVHDTTYLDVLDTLTIHDTLELNIYIYDTLTEYVPVHDTTTVTDTIYLPVYVHDTTTVRDTTYLPVYLYDTAYVDIHDTTYINVPYAVHDTTYIDVHDTTFIDVPYAVYDTTYINIHDTTYIDVPYAVHDTTYVDLYIYDTTVVMDTVTLTEYVPVHDTTYITLTDTVSNTIYDTITNTVFDTITNTIFDTTVVYSTDTLWLFDTVYIHDTIYIYDTVYVGVDEAETISAKIYTSRQQIVVEGADGNIVWLYDVNGRVLATKQDEYMPLRFDVPASGAYLVKIGNHPARKVVVIR